MTVNAGTIRNTALVLGVLLTFFIWGASSAQEVDWSGEYTSPHDVALKLQASGESNYSGMLSTAGQEYPVSLSATGPGLAGTFGSGADRFPLSLTPGTEAGQIVLSSQGSIYELTKRQAARNPLARSAANPLAKKVDASPQPAAVAASRLTGRFQHPGGYFSMRLPTGWQVNLLDEVVMQLDTGVGGETVLLVMAQLEGDEIGRSSVALMPAAHEVADQLLGQFEGIRPDSGEAKVQDKPVGGLSGAVSQRPATRYNGQPVRVWHALVSDGHSAYMLIASVAQGREQGLVPDLEAAFASLEIGQSSTTGHFGAAGQGIETGVRRVLFNGKALTAEELEKLEGGTPMIPDGEYWYDNRSGMAGAVGGPTEAYLAAGLTLGGPLDLNALGGGTRVAFNGRYLHPIDLAGLEIYLGELRPGRYWLDAQGNYGLENQGRMGNLVEEISAAQMAAAQYQAMYQQQLNELVMRYYGQGQGGGYYSGGGGYYGQQGGGGGSVYSHFPNLGSSGTGVGVADLGGGDSIVNAGGVLWWPGK